MKAFCLSMCEATGCVWQLVHKVICSQLSKLGGTDTLRALYFVCHKEILLFVREEDVKAFC